MAHLSTNLTVFNEYVAARRNILSAVGVSHSCRDPLAEFAEWLVAKEMNAQNAPSRVQKGYDLICNDGRKVQVKYLANPSPKWVNEHHVQFSSDVEWYALVVFEAFKVLAILVFQRASISDVCAKLNKKHPNQHCGLQMTRRNFMSILEDERTFSALGVRVYKPKS